MIKLAMAGFGMLINSASPIQAWVTLGVTPKIEYLKPFNLRGVTGTIG